MCGPVQHFGWRAGVFFFSSFFIWLFDPLNACQFFLRLKREGSCLNHPQILFLQRSNIIIIGITVAFSKLTQSIFLPGRSQRVLASKQIF